MENSGYVTLTRQTGLLREMRVVANNIANQATTGFRQQGLVFSEHVLKIDGGSSLSMAVGNAHQTSMLQGTLGSTGAQLDFAIEGDGFFLLQTPAGERLSRAGSFSPDANGELVNPQGYRVLDSGRAPVFIPSDARDISVSADGTLSADGQPLTQIGLFGPTDPVGLVREDGVMFRSEKGIEPAEGGRILQGYLEASNVDPVSQLARMIEVQRAYEMGQSFLDAENERVRSALKTFTR